MAWFQIVKYGTSISSTGPLSSDYINFPARRKIYINNLKENVYSGDQIYINLNSVVINKYLDSSLGLITDDYCYVVVLQDEEDETYFQPVKSYIEDNLLYFIAYEDIPKETISSKYYVIYYGIKNANLIIDQTVNNVKYYVQEDPEIIDGIWTPGTYYDLSSYDLTPIEVNEQSSGFYKLALYNSGIDWIDGISQKSGAKAFGTLDGPNFELYATSGPNYGKFKIRIFPYTSDDQINSKPVVDWLTIDCYDTIITQNKIVYSKYDLDYKKYIFEIETMEEKNIMAKTNSVNIVKYAIMPEYGLVYDKEEINTNLSFIKVSGVR